MSLIGQTSKAVFQEEYAAKKPSPNLSVAF